MVSTISQYSLAFVILLFITPFSSAQVGIGTTAPDTSTILDISSTDGGVLLPRLTTIERDAIATPATGLLIFNTDTNTFEFNNGITTAPVWAAVTFRTPTDTSGDSVKYSNTDTATDVNPGIAIDLPIFGNLEWNDNTALYAVAGNQVTINEAGRYEISVNVSLTNSTNSRNAPEIRINVNGTAIGSYSSTAYLRNMNNHDNSSLHLTEILNLNANDIVTISIVQEAAGGVVLLRSAGSSNIYIEKKS